MQNKPHFQPFAKVIADSLNIKTGDRLTTMVCTYHRFIHAEMLTHRMLSRNSSSSRSLSVRRMIQKVIDDNVYPLYWGKNQKGMQAHTEVTEEEKAIAIQVWDAARDSAIAYALKLDDLGLHKQIVNRVLEPFSTITVIYSATDWDNFFRQRVHPDAQPEIQAIALQMQQMMQQAYQQSTPARLQPGDVHLSFVDDLNKFNHSDSELMAISAGRCARVSYLNHDGVRDISNDLRLHDQLLSSDPPHLSPFEHQAVALDESKYVGNFKGFKQYRKILEGVN